MTFPHHAIEDFTEHQRRYDELRAEGLDEAEARAALAESIAYWRTTPWPADVAWRRWKAENTRLHTVITLIADESDFLATMRSLQEAFVAFFTAWTRKPCGAQICSCHPDPFPAARDYHRRTRHRRRRQR